MYKEILKVALWCCWWRHRDQSDLALHNLPYIFHHKIHYCDAIMGTVASQITSLTIVYTTVYSDADQSKHQSSASLAFVWGIHRRPVNSPHKWPVTRKMFPFDDVIMCFHLMTSSWKQSWRWHWFLYFPKTVTIFFYVWRSFEPKPKIECVAWATDYDNHNSYMFPRCSIKNWPS